MCIMSQTLKQHTEKQHNFHSLIKYVPSASFALRYYEGGGDIIVNMNSVPKEFRLKEAPRPTYVDHLKPNKTSCTRRLHSLAKTVSQ